MSTRAQVRQRDDHLGCGDVWIAGTELDVHDLEAALGITSRDSLDRRGVDSGLRRGRDLLCPREIPTYATAHRGSSGPVIPTLLVR